MYKDKTLRIGLLILLLAIPLAVGALSAWLTSKSMAAYGTMAKPPLSPPAWIFPLAWTILYILMGLASYFVMITDVDDKSDIRLAIALYALQLVFNFFWSIIFFRFDKPLIAFMWLSLMFIILVVCTMQFYSITHIAGYLMFPYILWMIFAGYLNLGSYLVRR